jgi:hypothetical protein
MAGPELHETRVPPLGDHDGDDEGHDHCRCGWCIPDAIPVYVTELPSSPDELTDDYAIPGVSVVLLCPLCSCAHVLTIGPKPPSNSSSKPN